MLDGLEHVHEDRNQDRNLRLKDEALSALRIQQSTKYKNSIKQLQRLVARIPKATLIHGAR